MTCGANATTTCGTNATTSCGTNGTSDCGTASIMNATVLDILWRPFLNESCLVSNDDETAHQVISYMNTFTDTLRFESLLGTMFGFVVCVMLLQLGGVPSPTGWLGKSMWAFWMTLVLFQFASTLLAWFALFLAYWSLRSQFHECMTSYQPKHSDFFLQYSKWHLVVTMYITVPDTYNILTSSNIPATMCFNTNPIVKSQLTYQTKPYDPCSRVVTSWCWRHTDHPHTTTLSKVLLLIKWRLERTGMLSKHQLHWMRGIMARTPRHGTAVVPSDAVETEVRTGSWLSRWRRNVSTRVSNIMTLLLAFLPGIFAYFLGMRNVKLLDMVWMTMLIHPQSWSRIMSMCIYVLVRVCDIARCCV